jgi:hypothetical protein
MHDECPEGPRRRGQDLQNGSLKLLKNPPRLITVVAAVILFALVFGARATATYDYKPGEFLVIDGGKSPDKKFSIVAGEDKTGDFGIYLMDAKTKKRLGPLEEVATTLDSAPDAYHAHWSPDSKHVGVSSRSDRHWMDNVIYQIENRRAYLVETPKLMCHAVPDFCRLAEELGGALTDEQIYADDDTTKPWKVRQWQSASQIVKWISPARFLVSEESQFQVKTRDPSAALGQYGEAEKQKEEGDEPSESYYVWFSTEGECELLPGDKSRVVNTRPVKEEEEKK